MKLIRKVFSAITYMVLMFIGFLFLIFFGGIGVYILLVTGDGINSIWDWVQNLIPLLADVEPPIALIVFIIEIPFIIMSFLGLAIILLTQRTTNIKRMLKNNI